MFQITDTEYDLTRSIGITIREYENMAKGLEPCGCGTIEVQPSIAYPDGQKVIQCQRHRGVRTYGA